jgi:MFS family permease
MCGAAQSQGVLLAGRALQGLGGALAAPAALSLITTTFAEGSERNRALGIFGAVAAAGATAGLIIGGALTDALSWRWVFYVNIPVGAPCCCSPRGSSARAATARRPLARHPRRRHVTAGLALVVYGVTRGQEDGFGATSTLLLLGAAATLLALFAFIETHVGRPLVPFRFFRRRAVSGANVVALASTGVIAGQAFFSTLYLQQILGYSPIETGLSFLPLSVAAFVGSGIASQLAGRIGTRLPLAAGLGCMGLGTLALTGISADGSYTGVLPAFVLFGLGLGLSFVSQTITATAGVDADQQGLASGLLNTSQQLGFAVGIAGLVSVAVAATEGSAAGGAAARLVDGYTTGYLACSAVALAGLIAALLLVPRMRPDRTPPPAGEHVPVATGTTA